MRQRVADDFRLFVNLLRHEVALAALVDDGGGGAGDLHLAVGGAALAIEDRDLGAVDHHDVVVLQIGDLVGEGREREGIGAEIGLVRAIADGERRALAGADQEALMAGEDHRQRIGAGQAAHRRLRRFGWGQAHVEEIGDEMHGDFRVGLRFEDVPLGEKLVAQLAEILDDAVVDDGDALAGMRMGVGLVRRAMRRPAGVADAGVAVQRAVVQDLAETVQLAGRAAALDMAMDQRGDAGGIVAAIFQALEGIQDDRRHVARSRDSYNAAHAAVPS